VLIIKHFTETSRISGNAEYIFFVHWLFIKLSIVSTSSIEVTIYVAIKDSAENSVTSNKALSIMFLFSFNIVCINFPVWF
jgi:hypothetical protein